MNKFFVFDLDGTLIDTLAGIQVALNTTLKEFNYKINNYTKEQVKTFIGGGAERMFRLATNGEGTKEQFSRYLVNYSKYQLISEPFPGVKETLKELQNRGYKLLIYSNKPHDVLVELINAKMSEIDFIAVQGNDFVHPPKPNVQLLNEIMLKNNLNPEDGYYVGDSKFDIMTSRNAHLRSIIVSYGYEDQKIFNDINYKCDYYINSFEEILNILWNAMKS